MCRLKCNDDSAVAGFRDTGIVIAADDLPNIVGRFYYADKASSCALGGIGIGLSIVRRVAEAHRGFEVQSAVGTGSVFRIVCLLFKSRLNQSGFSSSQPDWFAGDFQVAVRCLVRVDVYSASQDQETRPCTYLWAAGLGRRLLGEEHIRKHAKVF
jgi:hypothetical protein